MSNVTNFADFTGKAGGIGAPADDRRLNERQVATFRTCCVVVGGEARPAILRNISNGGAMFEALLDVKPDTRVTYWWDGIEAVEARIAWVEGNRIGVANLSGPASPVDVPKPRATRVPTCLPVRVWAGCKGRWTETANISMSGLAVRGLEDLAPGTLCTIEVGGQALHNASIVRREDGLTGIRFERPLAPAKLMQLLEGGGPAGRVATRPGIIDEAARRQEEAAAAQKRAAPPADAAPHDASPQDDRPRNEPIPLRRFL
ncbi:PilZ domain-containing protein [Alteriqipengyuania lutimaris]|uniref:PilZ domain-containing protein n=1 Tax=Alteriqipengyuania lutimaris TaxID=1538146 RepID=A0A395LMR9_9SPHN|nr:PilZ domain-containing protein [Alteriqipengyuania lutimaris]MBB3035333.1 hypothetical protein [Alteriqipengyuania lutimaris]RDS75920.1 PilZ domain-containing protein [Alteriqipengyuania lutimaris]